MALKRDMIRFSSLKGHHGCCDQKNYWRRWREETRRTGEGFAIIWQQKEQGFAHNQQNRWRELVIHFENRANDIFWWTENRVWKKEESRATLIIFQNKKKLEMIKTEMGKTVGGIHFYGRIRNRVWGVEQDEWVQGREMGWGCRYVCVLGA